MPTWTNSGAGPKQIKAINKALRKIIWEGKARVEITGIHGQPETQRRSRIVAMCGELSPVAAKYWEEIGNRFAWTITAANAVLVLAAAEGAVVDIYNNPPIDDCRITAEAQAAQISERRAAEQDRAIEGRAKSAEIDRIADDLRVKYPWAASIKAKSNHARAAASIKRELRDLFPGVDFSVRSSSYSGGNSVDVSWSMGPTSEEVDAILGKYESGRFDGMTDCYNYDNSAHADAVEIVLGQTKYAHGARHFPDAIYERIARDLCALQRVEFSSLNQRGLLGECDSESLQTHVYRLLSRTSFKPGEEYAGVVNAPENNDVGRRVDIVKTSPAVTVTATPAAEPIATAGGASLTENDERNGFELRFTAKPSDAIRDQLKAHGWRWSRFSGCWYITRSADARTFAESLLSSLPVA
jgi:hypothetical protein